MPRSFLDPLIPPLCPVCGRYDRVGVTPCRDCRRELAGLAPPPSRPPAGVAWMISAYPHEGRARDAVTALKVRGFCDLAGFMAEVIRDRLPDTPSRLVVIPVPPDPLRFRIRGFDPAGSIASALPTGRSRMTVRHDLLARGRGPRQAGRDRRSRLADPPPIVPTGRLRSGPVLLVDDVTTTGATLSVSARAVTEFGAGPVFAATFTRRL